MAWPFEGGFDDIGGLKPQGVRQRSCFGISLALALIVLTHAHARAAENSQMTEIVVIANAPLQGGHIDPNKVPGAVQILSVPALTRDRQTDVLPDAVAKQLSNVNLNDEQGSPFQPDFIYRGFEASPIAGVPQGIALYQDGTRLNEAFGDTVNWDLIPTFAINRLTVQSNSALFGLNAIGGVALLEMKSGLTFQGADLTLQGGSYGNLSGNAEYGARFDKIGVYAGLGGVHDDGFRHHSPTSLRQGYGDLAYQGERLTLHLSVSAAHNDIDAVGPTPIEMLAQDRKATFTFPQSMRNEMELVQLRGTWEASDIFTLSFNSYYRHFLQKLVDGNTTDVDYCDNDATQLCLEGDGEFPADALYGTNGAPVPASVLPGGATPGEIDFTSTRTDMFGTAVQADFSQSFADHKNALTLGASVDFGITNYSAFGELGTLLDSLEVAGSGVVIDQAQSPTAQPPIITPVNVQARNTYVGLYVNNIFDLTDRLSWTVSGRLNLATIELRDQIGTALSGDHHYTRFNPGSGFTYKLSEKTTFYAGYSESNRVPTAAELSCADPNAPCLLDAFLVSDPDLKQVVSHSFEFGLRGKFHATLPGTFDWTISAYRTTVEDDILLLATPVNGFGFFQNSGDTQRQGVDVRLAYQDKRWQISLGYSYLDATFQTSQFLSSNSPAANANGAVFVHAGDHLPMNAAHRIVISADYVIAPAFSLNTAKPYFW